MLNGASETSGDAGHLSPSHKGSRSGLAMLAGIEVGWTAEEVRHLIVNREKALGQPVVQPIQDGIIGNDAISADLYDLACGRRPGRRTDSEITLFKSVDAALEDLAGAVLAFETARAAKIAP
jgi:hypothetical protein